MASTKPITRSKGQSAVASASYRAGVKLEDKRYGKTHDYSKRHGVMSADIILPSSLKNQNITIERTELWNLAEETETRKNSRVAREWLVNLPHELDEETRKELAHEFTQALTDKFGTIADCAIHRPTEKEIERGADARNYHAHIMLTTRKAELDQDGKITLTDKADCEVSDSQRKKMGLSKAKDEVTEIRQIWETLANEKLLEHGHNLIDSRSYESQGIDILPQIKMGSVATKLERDGKQTIRGEINRAITERNELVFNIELSDNQRINDQADQIIFKNRINSESEQSNDELRTAIATINRTTKSTNSNVKWSDKRNSSLVKRVDAGQRAIERTRKNTAWANQRAERVNKIINVSERSIKESKRAIDQSSYVLVSQAGTKPSPFNIRTSIDSRERAVKQFAEQAEFFDSETKYSNANAQYRESEIVAVNQAVSDLINKTSVQFVNRHHSNDYSNAQLKLLDKFAEDNELTSHDVRKDIATVKEFLKDADNVQNNKHIINIIRDPVNNAVTKAPILASKASNQLTDRNTKVEAPKPIGRKPKL